MARVVAWTCAAGSVLALLVVASVGSAGVLVAAVVATLLAALAASELT